MIINSFYRRYSLTGIILGLICAANVVHASSITPEIGRAMFHRDGMAEVQFSVSNGKLQVNILRSFKEERSGTFTVFSGWPEGPELKNNKLYLIQDRPISIDGTYIIFFDVVDEEKRWIKLSGRSTMAGTREPLIIGRDSVEWDHLKWRYRIPESSPVTTIIDIHQELLALETEQDIRTYFDEGSVLEKIIFMEAYPIPGSIFATKHGENSGWLKGLLYSTLPDSHITNPYFMYNYYELLSTHLPPPLIQLKLIASLEHLLSHSNERLLVSEQNNNSPEQKYHSIITGILNRGVVSLNKSRSNFGIRKVENPPEIHSTMNKGKIREKSKEMKLFYHNNLKYGIFHSDPTNFSLDRRYIGSFFVLFNSKKEVLKRTGRNVIQQLKKMKDEILTIPARKNEETAKEWYIRTYKVNFIEVGRDKGPSSGSFKSNIKGGKEKNSKTEEWEQQIPKNASSSAVTEGSDRVRNGQERKTKEYGIEQQDSESTPGFRQTSNHEQNRKKPDTNDHRNHPENNLSSQSDPRTFPVRNVPLALFILLALAGAGTLGAGYVLSTRG